MSPYLFILSLEALAQMVRDNRVADWTCVTAPIRR